MRWGKDRDKSLRRPAGAATPADVVGVKCQVATPSGQTGGAEAAIGPGWSIHIEAEPRGRGREAVQSVAAFHKLPLEGKRSHKPKNIPSILLWQ